MSLRTHSMERAGEVCTRTVASLRRRAAWAVTPAGPGETRHRLASSTHVGAGKEPRLGISEGEVLWISLQGARGPRRVRLLGNWSVYAKQTEELCGRRGGAGDGEACGRERAV